MRKLFRKLILWATNEEAYVKNTTIGRLEPHQHIPMNKFVRFQVYAANGGLVIESTKFDHSTNDEPKVNLYVVTSHDDLPNQLAKIITYDNLVR